MEKQDLFGIYYTYDYRTKSYGQEYILEILAETIDKVGYVFIKKVRDPFGSSSITWKGHCLIGNNQLTLEPLENKK